MTPAEKAPDGLPIRFFRDGKSWEQWLERNHAKSSGIWVRMAKKASGRKSVSMTEAVEVALCYGWIDSRGRSDGPDFMLGRFTPRAKRSMWSKINQEKVLELIREGRMRPAGLAEIDRAKADGRWDRAYEPASRATVPPDLRAALDRDAKAKRFFATLDAQNRYAILFRLQTAKRPETRARRIERFVAMLSDGEKLYP